MLVILLLSSQYVLLRFNCINFGHPLYSVFTCKENFTINNYTWPVTTNRNDTRNQSGNPICEFCEKLKTLAPCLWLVSEQFLDDVFLLIRVKYREQKSKTKAFIISFMWINVIKPKLNSNQCSQRFLVCQVRSAAGRPIGDLQGSCASPHYMCSSVSWSLQIIYTSVVLANLCGSFLWLLPACFVLDRDMHTRNTHNSQAAAFDALSLVNVSEGNSVAAW